MKLSQLLEYDISDYQSGDENNPRSPYYKGDPPDYKHDTDDDPVIKVRAVQGQTPKGEPYNLEIITTWRGGWKGIEYMIADTVLDTLMAEMPGELVHDETGGGATTQNPIAPTFYKACFQTQATAEEVQQKANALIARFGPEIGEKYYEKNPPNRNDDY